MRYLAPAFAAVAMLTLAGCGGSDNTADEKPSTPAAETSAPAAAPAAAPSPDAAQTKALMTTLGNIKPQLAADAEKSVRRARNVCSDVKAGKDAATMASNANFRFSGGDVGELTDAQGAKIVDAVKATFCK